MVITSSLLAMKNPAKTRKVTLLFKNIIKTVISFKINK